MSDFDFFNLGFLEQSLGVVTFDNTYTLWPKNDTISPCETATNGGWNLKQKRSRERYIRLFYPSEFDSQEDENNSWQVVKNEAPSEEGVTPQYTGYDDSVQKISEWNATGRNPFNWYCPAVRGSV